MVNESPDFTLFGMWPILVVMVTRSTLENTMLVPFGSQATILPSLSNQCPVPSPVVRLLSVPSGSTP